MADRWGTGRVLLAGVLLVALGTALIPLATTAAAAALPSRRPAAPSVAKRSANGSVRSLR